MKNLGIFKSHWKVNKHNMWIFKAKKYVNPTSPRYKVILVVKDFRNIKGVDFNILLLVMKTSFIIPMASLVPTLDLEVEQMDVKTTFIHGNLKEELYKKHRSGFLVEANDYVCRLRKILYSLK